MIRFNLCVALFAAVLMTIICQPAAAVVLYQEDFEGVSLPATLLDVGYTWAFGGPVDAPITTTSELNATQALDPPGSDYQAAVHSIPSPAAGSIYTLTADAYFHSPANGGSHDTMIGLAGSAISAGWDNGAGAFIRNDWTGGDLGLQFDLSGLGGTYQYFTPGFANDMPSSLTIEIDLINDVATGTVTAGAVTEILSGTISNVANALIINQISIVQYQAGFDLDNMLLIGVAGDLVGDLDGNGYVSDEDLDLLRTWWGQSVGPAPASADPSGDSFVGGADFDIVMNNWHLGTPVASTVPEPGSLVMLALGSFVLLVLRRRCRV